MDVSNKLMMSAWRAAMQRQYNCTEQLRELEHGIATVRAEMETNKGIILQLEVAMTKLGMELPDAASFKPSDYTPRATIDGALS